MTLPTSAPEKGFRYGLIRTSNLAFALGALGLLTGSYSLYRQVRLEHNIVTEYTLERDGCCTIIGMSPDQTQWHLVKNDGPFWLDFCGGPQEYDPKHFGAKIGMEIVKVRYLERDCGKSVMRPDLGVWFAHNSQGENVYAR